MRFLHTSDWHLGRSFHGTSLLSAQEAFLEHLVRVVREQGVEAVLVSGDVYDRALPSPAAVALLDRTLVHLRQAGAQVVISSGNHDSATRLGFARQILAAGGVHVRTGLDQLSEPVPIGPVDVYPLPYLDPLVAADALGCQERTHAAVVGAAMDRVRTAVQDRQRPSVVMAHLFAARATSSDSERDISVGGLAVVPLRVFDGVDYVALGHLHRPQALTDRVRYSGAPVAMSFGEAGQVKQSLLVDLDTTGLSVQPVPAPVQRPVVQLRATLAELLTEASYAAHEGSWVQATLTDLTRPERAMERLRTRFPHCLQVLFDGPASLSDRRSYTERVAGRSDLEVCCDFVTHVRGGRGVENAEQAVLQAALESALRRADPDADAQPVTEASGVA